jgi:UDP-N-acetylenolpyruvoylglucosamine reductase
VVLSLTRMNAVRAIDKDNLTITVEAGCMLQNVQEAAEAAGYLFPLSLAAEGSCTIGGNLGTNAGGTQVVRYGNARELCLGLEVVTAQGEVWHGLSGLRKDNTGYDLRDLFIGSEGTLGIITAATMKLYPLPAAQLTAWAAVRPWKPPWRCWDWPTIISARADRFRGHGPLCAEPGEQALPPAAACRSTRRRRLFSSCWRSPTTNPKPTPAPCSRPA